MTSFVRATMRLAKLTGEQPPPWDAGTVVQLTYPIRTIRDPGAAGGPVIYDTRTTQGVIDNAGVLKDASGAVGLLVLDPNDAAVQPHGYTLRVDVIPQGVPTGQKWVTYALLATPELDGSYDLARNTPAEPATGVAVTKGDPGEGVPVGGTTGQALVKLGGADYATGWATIDPAFVGAATATQGGKADTAVQPASLAAVATSGAYGDLSGKPAIPVVATAAPADLGAAAAIGSSGKWADAAHVHKRPTLGELGAAASSVKMQAGTGLTGGGDLTADRSFAVSYGTAAGTAAQGNDSRIVAAVPNTGPTAASVWLGTQAQYDAILTPAADTLYVAR